MDDDLWGPPSYPVEEDDYYNVESGDYNFYFDNRLDVIKEEALNERSCMQVLRLQMEKANTENCETESRKVLLQNELDCIGNSDKDAKNCNLNDAENTEIRAPNAYAGQHLSLNTLEDMTKDLETLEMPAKFPNSDTSRDQIFTNTKITVEDFEPMIEKTGVKIDSIQDLPWQADSIQDFKIQQPKSGFSIHLTTNVDRNESTQQTEVQNFCKSNSLHRAPDESRACLSSALNKVLPSGEKYGSPNMNQRLAEAKHILKEIDSFPSAGVIGSLLSFLEEEKGTTSSQIYNFQEILTATQRSCVKFHSEICGYRVDEEEYEIAETSGSNEEMILKLFSYPRGRQPDECTEFSPESIENPGSVSTEHHQGKKTSNYKAFSNKSLNENIKNRETRSRELGFISKEIEKPFKKRKDLATPTVNEVNPFTAKTQSFIQRDSMSSLTKNDEQMTVASELKDMKLKDLRSIAKGQKLTNYRKLKKNDLVERLTNRLGPT